MIIVHGKLPDMDSLLPVSAVQHTRKGAVRFFGLRPFLFLFQFAALQVCGKTALLLRILHLLKSSESGLQVIIHDRAKHLCPKLLLTALKSFICLRLTVKEFAQVGKSFPGLDQFTS